MANQYVDDDNDEEFLDAVGKNAEGDLRYSVKGY